jgi:hypothetical protein
MIPSECYLRIYDCTLPARHHPSHVTIRCSHCGSAHLIRVAPETDPGAVADSPSRLRRIREWVRRNAGFLVIFGCMVGMLWFVGGGYIWVPGR